MCKIDLLNNQSIIGFAYQGSTKVAEYKYDAWGNCTITLDTDGIGTANPFRYRGYYWDNDLNLYYVQGRFYDPQTGRFISSASVSSLNPRAINGLNLYSYASNNPIGIVYSSSDVGENASGRMASFVGNSSFSLHNNISRKIFVFDPNFLGNFFAHNADVFSTGAGIVDVIRQSKGLEQLEALSKISKVLMHTGYWLNVLLDAHNNFSNEELSLRERWVSFAVDTIHNTGQTIGSHFLGCVPYAGPFLAIGVPITVDYFWSGELCIFGFDIDVEPILIEGKTFEEWVKYWVNSWFE